MFLKPVILHISALRYVGSVYYSRYIFKLKGNTRIGEMCVLFNGHIQAYFIIYAVVTQITFTKESNPEYLLLWLSLI
jgi:hypothetical protein